MEIASCNLILMKDTLINFAAKLGLPTLVRNLVAAISGLALHAGYTGEISTTAGIIAFVGSFGLASVWSLIDKKFHAVLERFHIADASGDIDAEATALKKQLWSMITGSIASASMSALAGWLALQGFHGDVNDPTAVLVFVGTWALSLTRGKAAKAK
ncbi:MAG: hypothetical protein E6R03_02090 [Hyphomicrobiaceae bacterium]|nr:MAG: hypothetical protein E6R03_02090 [Hyphomicrobiaceae bacterium]